MKRLKPLFEFGNDFLLTVFLLTLMVVPFVGALSLSPVGANLFGTTAILGASTDQGELDIIPVFEQFGNLNAELLDADSEKISILFSNEGFRAGVSNSQIARIENNTTHDQTVSVQAGIAESFRSGMRYSLVVDDVEHIIYDDNSERLLREFEINLEPGAETNVNLQITAYRNIGYGSEFVITISEFHLSELP
ncbi:MAG: hypothetical protein ACE5DX_05060 [Candidatus Dojkabacteria bacterium]